MIKRITPKQFRFFKAQCEGFIRAWGLGDWEVIILLRDIPSEKCAQTGTSLEARKAVIELTTKWDDCDGIEPPDKKHLRMIAAHEVLHVLLAPLHDLVFSDRKIAGQEREGAEHSIVKRLLRIMGYI